MKFSDVNAALGAPPGDYGLGKITSIGGVGKAEVLFYDLDEKSLALFRGGTSYKWIGDDVAVRVMFDGDGKMTSCFHVFIWREPTTYFDRLRSWLCL
jgi:hypothetical protein